MFNLTTDNLDTLFKQYPHIGDKINALWGTAECRKMLVSLLSDSRDGAREGFPPAIAKEILGMLKAHDDKYPQFDTTTDIIPPFKSYRPPVVIDRSSPNDWWVLKAAAYFTVAILVLTVLTFVIRFAKMFM